MANKKEEKEKVQNEESSTRKPVETDNPKIGDTPPPLPKKKVCEVLQIFRDKDSLEVFEVGSSYEGESKRIKELQSLGFLGKEK